MSSAMRLTLSYYYVRSAKRNTELLSDVSFILTTMFTLGLKYCDS